MTQKDDERAREIVKEYTKDWLQPNLINLNGMVPLITDLIASIRKETVEERDNLKESLEGMVNQFAYPGRPVNGVASITTGGLSALEDAFDVLGYSDPQPMPHKQCQWSEGCLEHSTCGTPTKDGYKFLCGKHYAQVERGNIQERSEP